MTRGDGPEPAPCRHCGLPVPRGLASGPGPWFCCFGCRFANRLAAPSSAGEVGDGEQPRSTMLLRLGIGIFLALNIMAASWLSYAHEFFGAAAQAPEVDRALTSLFAYAALFLCSALIALLGVPLLADAVRPFAGGVPSGRVTAQLLIVIGVFSAFALSAWNTVRGDGSLYFDTSAVILVVVSLGSYLEANARRRATAAASRLLGGLPRAVRLRRDGHETEVGLEAVRPGDRVGVRPGDIVPVDGRVLEGRCHVDEATLTGESRPRGVGPGDEILAGSTCLDGPLWLDAERVAADTVVAIMERALAEARSSRPAIQRTADRVAAVFVPAVVALALVVLGAGIARGDAVDGLMRALGVLLISCPCALGLAAPLATWYGLRRAAARGLLVDGPATLERAAAIRRVFVDKTGTLTRPTLDLGEVRTAPGIAPAAALAWASSLGAASHHPVAGAIVRSARRDVSTSSTTPAAPESVTEHAGLGIEGRIPGRRLFLGSVAWACERGLGDDPLVATVVDPGGTVLLTDDARTLARFDLREHLRPDARAALDGLRALGIEVSIASGDRPAAVARVGEMLGVEGQGGLRPAEKVEHLQAARRHGGAVAMVGDGLNDAAVLAAADVGVAVGSASDLAQRSGHVRLTGDRLMAVPELVVLARHVRRQIRLNLAWAFGWNTVGIVLAAVGWLSPVFAAIAMVASSLIVIRISSRAGRVDATRPVVGTSPATPRLDALSEARA